MGFTDTGNAVPAAGTGTSTWLSLRTRLTVTVTFFFPGFLFHGHGARTRSRSFLGKQVFQGLLRFGEGGFHGVDEGLFNPALHVFFDLFKLLGLGNLPLD